MSWAAGPHCEPLHKNAVEMEDNAYELHAILHFLSDNHVCLSCHCVKIINSWEKGLLYELPMHNCGAVQLIIICVRLFLNVELSNLSEDKTFISGQLVVSK